MTTGNIDVRFVLPKQIIRLSKYRDRFTAFFVVGQALPGSIIKILKQFIAHECLLTQVSRVLLCN